MTQRYGFIAALPGKKATSSDPAELSFASIFNTLKTFVTGIVSKAASSGTLTTVQVRHGLGYRPAFNAYYKDTASGEVYQCASGFENINFNRVGAQISVHARADNYNISFDIYQSTGSSKNVDIFYEVFYDDMTTEPLFFIG